MTPEKGSRPRILPISLKLLAMLRRLPMEEERVFPASRNSIYETFEKSRKRVAEKLQNPRLLRISFHTLRHWKATMEYHKTKDILYVKQILGHKKIENIERALFQTQNDEFHSAVAEKIEEARKLIEAGFEYVCDLNGVKLFRKRK